MKGLVPFVEAVDAELVKAGWRIVIMGQGPDENAIRKKAEQKGISDRLTILNYVPYEQMPIVYAAADLFLLPSIHDPNPLSVPEALHTGLPIALSDRCGNVEEGVMDGVNGWRLPVLECENYKNSLREVFAANRVKLQCMGEKSKTVNAAFWATQKSIRRFVAIVLEDETGGMD